MIGMSIGSDKVDIQATGCTYTYMLGALGTLECEICIVITRKEGGIRWGDEMNFILHSVSKYIPYNITSFIFLVSLFSHLLISLFTYIGLQSSNDDS